MNALRKQSASIKKIGNSRCDAAFPGFLTLIVGFISVIFCLSPFTSIQRAPLCRTPQYNRARPLTAGQLRSRYPMLRLNRIREDRPELWVSTYVRR